MLFRSLKEQSTLSEIAKKFEISPVVISRWKSEFAANMSAVFKKSNPNEALEENVDIEKLYAQIGQLKVENDFLKKSARKLGIPDNELKW